MAREGQEGIGGVDLLDAGVCGGGGVRKCGKAGMCGEQGCMEGAYEGPGARKWVCSASSRSAVCVGSQRSPMETLGIAITGQ